MGEQARGRGKGQGEGEGAGGGREGCQEGGQKPLALPAGGSRSGWLKLQALEPARASVTVGVGRGLRRSRAKLAQLCPRHPRSSHCCF